MKEKIANILIITVLILSTLMFLPWTYLTPIYYIARYVIMVMILTTLGLSFSIGNTFSVRFVRLLLLTIIAMFLILIFLPIQPNDILQLIITLVTLTVGINLKWGDKSWANVFYYYTVTMIIVTICNCLFFAGNLKVPEYYMVNEGKNQIGAMLVVGAAACFYFGMKQKENRGVLWIVSFLAMLCTIIIRARSDFFALLACVLLIIVKDAEFNLKFNAKTIISVIAIATTAYIVYTGFIGDEIHTFMYGGKNNTTINEITSRRWVRNQQGMDILWHTNNIEEVKNSTKIPFIHNYPLLRLVRYGIFSLPLILFYVYFGLSCLFEIFKSRRSSVKQVGWIISTIPLIISFAEPNFPYGPGLVQLPVFLLLGYSLRPDFVEPRKLSNGTKILHICNDFCNSKVHTNLYSELDKEGKEQIVFVPIRKKSKENNRFAASNTQFVFAHILNPLHRMFFFHKIERTVKEIEKNINLDEVKICHATTLFSDGMVARELNRKYAIPYVVATRNSDMNAFLKFMPHLWWVHRDVLSRAEKTLFITPSLENRLLKHFTLFGIRDKIKQKSMVIPNGIDDFWHKNLSLSSKFNHNIIYAGNFSNNKNTLRLTNAVLNLKNSIPDIHLDLVGDNGAQEKKILTLVAKYPQTLSYHGKITDNKKMKQLYQSNSLFAMPSKSETFGLVYIEALSQGLKVVWSRGEAIDGMFSQNIGESVNPYKQSDIETVIAKVLDNKDYDTLDEADFEQFRWNIIANKYLKLYKSID